MATKKLATSKIIVTLIMPTTACRNLGKAAHAMELAHDKKKGDHYKRDMRALSANLGTGRDDIAVAELKRRKAEYFKGCGYVDSTAWNASAERKGLERAAKAIGFKAPTTEKEPTSESDKKKQANKIAAEKSRAKKAIIAAKPSRKFKDGELDELIKVKLADTKAQQSDAVKGIKGFRSVADRVAAESSRLPAYAALVDRDTAQIMLRFAAGILELRTLATEVEKTL